MADNGFFLDFLGALHYDINRWSYNKFLVNRCGYMKKKMLAWLCLLSVLIGVMALSATATTSEVNTFQVGCSKVDINPYYDEENDRRIMPLPLRGLGSPATRLAYEYQMDDNGSGRVDDMAADGTGGDGLFLICIAITDNDGNTVLLFTMDAIGDMGHTAAAREAIVERLGATYGITADRIMVSGTHAHSGIDLTQLNVNSFKNDNTADVEVVKADGKSSYYISGSKAYEYLQTYWDRLIDKFVVAAKAAMDDRAAATVSKGQIETDQSVAAKGKTMNFVRHYVGTDSSNHHDYVMDTYSNPDVNGTLVGHVSDVDQTLHAISFNFDDGTNKKPIVLVNWRNHPQFSSSADSRVVSSDYINAFRYRMEQSGYRPAFFQGTGGNTQPDSRINSERWVSRYNKNIRGYHYGRVLAEVTLECLKNNMTEVAAGKVQTMQNIYAAERINYSQVKYNAAVAALAQTTYPFQYTQNNETVVISCSSQASKIVEHYKNYSIYGKKTIDLEIDTIMIGPQIAIVTCPGEPFDRYSQQAADEIKALWNDDSIAVTYAEYHKIANKYNDWDKLKNVNNAQYGEPLIFGYTNQHITYIPNALAYNYNAEHPELYSTSSYESFMTPLAEGGGEKMVANLAEMLREMVNDEVAYCQYCQKDVYWYSLNQWSVDKDYTHYYLSEDTQISRKSLNKGRVLCLDLNGFTLTGSNRTFNTSEKAVLNIMDSSDDQTGRMVGTGAAMSGGTIWVDPNSTVNIYGGTITCDTSAQKTAHGGVLYIKGTVNVYGGRILGGNANNNGGAIYVNDADAQLNVYGGEIMEGTAVAFGNCVAVNAGVVKIAGNAKIDEIYYLTAPAADTFRVVSTADKPAFTGKVVLNKNEIIADGKTVLGAMTARWDPKGIITVSDGTQVALTQENRLIALREITHTAVVSNENALAVFDSLESAIANVGTGHIILGQNVDELTVSKDLTVDLNGMDVAKAEVAAGATLKLKDRKTDDYQVDDNDYGVVENISGNVVAAENYLAIPQIQGISYHRYAMQIKSVTLRPGCSGIYYKSEFLGDSAIAQQIDTFGVALHLSQVPNEYNMTPDTYSAFTKEAFGSENTSTVLVDIMKSDDVQNAENAKKQVYGRAYIKFVDGSYLFSDIECYSLQELTEIISNEYWAVLTQIQKNEIMNMYDRFKAVMVSWDIDNIKAAYAAQQP